jgi:DHA1 family multidrug resistance protein-like MFS transporter
MQTAVLAGVATGPTLGGMMADAMGYRWPFVLSGAMCLVAALVVLLFTREHFVPPPAQRAREQGSTLQLVRQTPGFTTMLGIFFLVGVAGTVVGPIFPLFVEQINGQAHLNFITGAIIGIAGVAEGIAAVTIGRLSDRKGQKKILVGCTLASGLVCAPQAIATSVGQLFGLRAALGLAGGGTAPTINALVGRLVPEHSYGRMFAYPPRWPAWEAHWGR